MNTTMKTTGNDQDTKSKDLEEQRLEPSEVARLIVEVASEKLASDIVMLDLRGLASFTDYFVVMSADSSRLIQALEEGIATTLKESKLSIHRREGTAASGWVLMDCSDVIVHIFGPEEREFFGLERLWARAPQVVRIL
jgi:ribosome-associated protein